jgi:hypothetical protein
MSINRQELTNAGRDMLGRANAGESLTISRMVIGAGRAAAPADLWPLTSLLDHRLNVPFTQKRDQGNGVLLCEGGFNSSSVAAAFELCEVGVMAHIGAEADRLYSVANVMATGADNVDPAVESIHAFKIKVVIDRAPNVTVVIGTSDDIMAENIGADTVGPGWFREKIANTLRFKRAVAGTGIELIENPADPFAITISQKTLIADLDLYVPLNNPGGTPTTRFATIQQAHDYLLDYYIPPNRFANINVGLMDLVSATISINHPQSSQIRILGSRGPIININDPGGTWTGINGAYLYNIQVNSVAGLAINDWVLNLDVGNFESNLLNGMYRVVNIPDSTHVTIGIPYFGTPLIMPAFTGTMSKFESLVRMAGNTSGFDILGSGLSLMQDIGIVGIRDISVVTPIAGVVSFTRDLVTLIRVGAYGFTDLANIAAGFISRGIMRCTDCAAMICSNGFVSDDSTIECEFCYANFSVGYNYRSEGGLIRLRTFCLGFNARQDGILIANQARLVINGTVRTSYNVRSGLWLIGQSYCVIEIDSALYADRANGGPDALLEIGSTLLRIDDATSLLGIRPGAVGTNVPRNPGDPGSLAVVPPGTSLLSLDGSMITPAQGTSAEEEAPETLPEI